MALKEFVGGSGTKQDFQPTPIRGSAYEKRGGQNSIQTPFLSQDFFFWGGGGMRKMKSAVRMFVIRLKRG